MAPHSEVTRDRQQNEAKKRSKEVPGTDWWALRDYPPPDPGTARLCPRLWQAWVAGLIAGSMFLLEFDIWVYVGFVASLFLGTAVIPDSGDSPSPYFMHLAIPFFAVKGVHEGGGWTAISFYWAFFFLPFADFVVGVDTFNKRDAEYKVLRERKWFRIASWIFLPAQLALLAYACHAVNTIPLTPLEFLGFVVSVAVYTGGIGITLSHELVHKSNRIEQWLGRAMCVMISYGHFYVEHNRGHHKLVATDEDPATARFGESFYAFLPRCVVGSFASAWRLETDRLRDRNLPFYHNEMLWYWVASSCLCALLTAMFGPLTVPLFVGQSLIGIFFFESVNYVEHYGLERKRDEQGKTEPVGFEHSWDAPHRLTNMVLFKLQRHGDHHVNSTRRYQTLRAEPSRSPQLPLGYPGCILLALFPPLWRAVMDKRVLKLRSKNHPGRAWRHGPPP
ncbi:unnamed protein product [Ectocarpus sp. CCAP 1310/34]|nr:unnamed protein product [Ectocarpus sp. CCAP 1310/34]